MTLHKGDQSCGLCSCLTHVQVSYGVTLLNEGEGPIVEHPRLLQLLQKSNSYAGLFKPRRGMWKMPHMTDTGGPQVFPDEAALLPPEPVPRASNDRIVFVIPLEGRYRTLERFMENYERNFLIPLSHGGASPGFGSSVQLAIVLFEPGNGDDSGLNRATIRLLDSYQKSYNSDLIRYHTITESSRKFSRGAGK